MGSRILQTCGGFALAFLGCLLSYHGDKTVGLLLAVGGTIMLFNSLPSTTRKD